MVKNTEESHLLGSQGTMQNCPSKQSFQVSKDSNKELTMEGIYLVIPVGRKSQ